MKSHGLFANLGQFCLFEILLKRALWISFAVRLSHGSRGVFWSLSETPGRLIFPSSAKMCLNFEVFQMDTASASSSIWRWKRVYKSAFKLRNTRQTPVSKGKSIVYFKCKVWILEESRGFPTKKVRDTHAVLKKRWGCKRTAAAMTGSNCIF